LGGEPAVNLRGGIFRARMLSERVVTSALAVAFVALSLFLWRDYLDHSRDLYDQRDIAQAQITDLSRQISTVQDADQLVELTDERSDAESAYAAAERSINDMDGWDSSAWKAKNSFRLGAPVAAALFGAFTLLSILKPLKP
jgi:hypothetical protein